MFSMLAASARSSARVPLVEYREDRAFEMDALRDKMQILRLRLM